MSLLTAEAIIILPIAILLDLIGIICLILDIYVGAGEILSYIPDAIGLIFFGLWITFRGLTKELTEEEVKKKKGELVEKVAERKKEREMMRMKRKMPKLKGIKVGRFAKFGLASLGELIPFIGALPFWTIYVLAELKSD